jgi:hypothetical protein
MVSDTRWRLSSENRTMTVTGWTWNSWRGPGRLLAVLAVILIAGCDEASPTAPSVPLNQRFTLAPGESASIAGASIVVEMVRVSNDSRCPGDAICIQGGDALVHIVVHGGVASNYELHTGDAARGSVQHGTVRITLIELQPYPFNSLPAIRPEQYRATFTASAR